MTPTPNPKDDGVQVLSRPSKLESAVIALVEAQNEVRRLGKEIGAAICASFDAQRQPDGMLPAEPVDWLKLAYQRDYESDGSYGRQYYYVNHEEDVEGYLAEHCQHSLRAHHLIQERKEAKRQLGIAKRRVSVMGAALLRARQENTNG